MGKEWQGFVVRIAAADYIYSGISVKSGKIGPTDG